MSDRWTRAGGSAWLDSLLYDETGPEAGVLLGFDTRPPGEWAQAPEHAASIDSGDTELAW